MPVATATCPKSHADRRIMNRATFIAVGANLETGCRAVLGVETFRLSFLRKLADPKRKEVNPFCHVFHFTMFTFYPYPAQVK